MPAYFSIVSFKSKRPTDFRLDPVAHLFCEAGLWREMACGIEF